MGARRGVLVGHRLSFRPFVRSSVVVRCPWFVVLRSSFVARRSSSIARRCSARSPLGRRSSSASSVVFARAFSRGVRARCARDVMASMCAPKGPATFDPRVPRPGAAEGQERRAESSARGPRRQRPGAPRRAVEGVVTRGAGNERSERSPAPLASVPPSSPRSPPSRRRARLASPPRHVRLSFSPLLLASVSPSLLAFASR